jgi:uncharacterized glyoxalase superfamily protein PhnB
MRPGFRALNPTLRVESVDRFIEFMKKALGAEESERTTAEDGTVMNAQVRILDAMFEVSDPRGKWRKVLGAFHLSPT